MSWSADNNGDIALVATTEWWHSGREPQPIALTEDDVAVINDLNDQVNAAERYNENWVLKIWGGDTASEGGETLYKWKTNSVVGVFGLSSGRRLWIEPSKSPTNLGWLLQYALRIEPVLDSTEIRVGDDAGFIDALAALYAIELEQALRGGINRDYQQTDQARESIRGRFDLTRQLQSHGPVATSFECRHNELTSDTPLNRALLLAASEFRARTKIRRLESDLERLERRLARHVSREMVTSRELADVTLTRLNERYHDAFRMAKYVIDGRNVGGFDEAVDTFSLLFSLSTVFEDVARRALEEGGIHDAGWSIDGQAERPVTEDGDFQIRPDLLIVNNSGEPAIVGDAKWKSTDRLKPRESDLYQLISYQTIESSPGVLVYPAQKRSFSPTVLQIRGSDPLYIIELPTDADATSYETYTKQLREAAGRIFGVMQNEGRDT